MKIVSFSMACCLVALVACSTDDQKKSDATKEPEAAPAAAETMTDEATLATLPMMVMVKVPVVDGVEQHDQAQVVSVDASSEFADDAEAAAAFEGGSAVTMKSNVDELDQTSSSQQWCWGGGSYGYGGGYGYGSGYGYGGSYGYGGYSPYLYSGGYGYGYGYSNSYGFGGCNYYSYYRPTCGYSYGYGYY